MRLLTAALLLITITTFGCSGAAGPAAGEASRPASATTLDPLPAWNEGAAKRDVVAFVGRVTRSGSPGFVPPSDRIAVFDNDGTLWAEQPVYVQLAFMVDRIRALAVEHPGWRYLEPFKSVIEGDLDSALRGGEKSISELVAISHAGMTTEEFERIVAEWLSRARHPRFDRRYTDLVYQPMLELIAYLKANDFQVYIASGGGVDFMRVWAEKAYGIPRANVIGSRIATELVERSGAPALLRKGRVDHVNDGPGKPVGIFERVGRRPIAAFGNSDGDLQMLEWTTAGGGGRFGLLVRHTDAEREWAYDRDSKIGKLDLALDRAETNGWTVVDMRRDWLRIFPFDERAEDRGDRR